MHNSYIRTLLGALMLGACVLFSSPAALKAAPPAYDGPLSRTVSGSYGYNRPGRPPVRFSFTVQTVTRDRGDRNTFYISGVIREPRSDFGPRGPFLTSSFSGKYVDGPRGKAWIEFTKRYDFGGPATRYEGRLDRQSGCFEGTWDQRGGGPGGTFSLGDITQRGR